jgi:ElaB/YqjD/DUF883 family membrane-anchored ribosome-binding protein
MANDEIELGIWTNPGSGDTKPVIGETRLVDEVLAEKNAERGSEAFAPDASQELDALRAEIDRLRASIHEIASSSKRLATAEFDELKTAAEEKLNQNVFLSVGVAALVGYLWGRTRR